MKLEGAKVAVLGGTGFIGANLVNRLKGMGCKVRATYLTRLPIHSENVLWMNADLTREDHCRWAMEDMDFAFMCAANTSGAAVIVGNPIAHLTTNMVMNSRIMEAAYLAGVKKFVFVSSSTVYPPSGSRKVREDDLLCDDPADVYFAVGYMKRYGEVLGRIYSQKVKNPMPVCVIRPSNIYGPFDKFDPQTSHVIPGLIRKVVERQSPLEVWGTGEDVRDMTYIDDFIDGMIAAAQLDLPHITVNLASGHGTAVHSILQTILTIEHWESADVRFNPGKPSTIPIRLVDISLAQKLFGYAPKYDLHAGLTKTIEWYKETLRQEWESKL